jgi:uncharacterized lipoprotein YddW (UPF0748 family)
LSSLKDEIHQARRRAALAVNSEMILLYWRIGREIVQRQAVHKWGARVIDQLATDLHSGSQMSEVSRLEQVPFRRKRSLSF